MFKSTNHYTHDFLNITALCYINWVNLQQYFKGQFKVPSMDKDFHVRQKEQFLYKFVILYFYTSYMDTPVYIIVLKNITDNRILLTGQWSPRWPQMCQPCTEGSSYDTTPAAVCRLKFSSRERSIDGGEPSAYLSSFPVQPRLQIIKEKRKYIYNICTWVANLYHSSAHLELGYFYIHVLILYILGPMFIPS